MKSLKLSVLFESVINGRVDLTPYPELKKLVDLYKPVKIGGEYLIRPDDFDSLLVANDEHTKDVYTFYSRGEYDKDLPNSFPQYRVYNFNKELRKKLGGQNAQDPKYNEYKQAYEELNDLMFSISKNKKNQKPQRNQNPATEPQQEPISSFKPLKDTDNLKNFTSLTVGDKVHTITDHTLAVFETKLTDPNVEKYKNAMYNDDLSLPDDPNSEEGLIYTLFKKLKTNCTTLLSSQVVIDDKMKNSGPSFSSINNKQAQNPFTSVQKLDLSILPKGAEVYVNYSLRNRDGSYYTGRYDTYEGYFHFTDLTWEYRFINKVDKNNYFIFDRRSVQSILEIRHSYEVSYSTGNVSGVRLYMDIISLKTKHKDDKSNLSALSPCLAMDELIDILKLD